MVPVSLNLQNYSKIILLFFNKSLYTYKINGAKYTISNIPYFVKFYIIQLIRYKVKMNNGGNDVFQKIYQSSIFTSKLALRTWLIPIIFIVLHSYIILGFYMYRFESFSPPSALTALSPFVIFSMLAYLLFGVWIIRIENSSSMRELKLLIHNGYIAGFIGKCLIGILSILLGQLLIMIAYVSMFYGQPIIDVTYYISVFNYITIFWSASFFISFMLGMLLASLIKGKIIYKMYPIR